jgi:hypothetical protein
MGVVGILLCCIGTGAVIIMVAPFVLTMEFSTARDFRTGVLLFQWIHPMVALVKYRQGDGATEFRVFGRTVTMAHGRKRPDGRSGSGKEPPGTMPGPGADEIAEKRQVEKPDRRGPFAKSGGTGAEPPVSPETGPQDESPDAATPADRPAPNRLTWTALRKTIAVLRQGHGGAKIFRWFVRLLALSTRIIRFDHLRLHARVGLEDPAVTGRLYGYFVAVNAALFGDRKNMDVRLDPRFMSNVLELEGSVGLKSSIAAVVTPLFVALITFPYVTVFFVWRRLKKVYKE